MIQIRLLKLREPDRRIHAIKALRACGGYGLKEAKDIIIDQLVNAGRTVVVSVHDDSVDLRVLDLYVEYEVIGAKIRLRLWKVAFALDTHFILASSKEKASDVVTQRFSITDPRVVQEVTGPFYDGYIIQ